MKDAISNKAQVRATLPLNEIGDQNISSLSILRKPHQDYR